MAPLLRRAHRSDRPSDGALRTATPDLRPTASQVPQAARLCAVSVVRDGRPILDQVDWTVSAGERWVLLGPNGSGKTTLLQVAGARLWPTSGLVEVLGERIGRVDMRILRSRVALTSGAVARQLRADLTAREIVVTGLDGALEPWWRQYSDEEWAEADRLLAAIGTAASSPTPGARLGPEAPDRGDGSAGIPAGGSLRHPTDGSAGDCSQGWTIGSKPFNLLSEGERQQVLLCRALMGWPEMLLLDEPAAGLDLGARERLLLHLSSLAADPEVPPLVLVTHHLEEIPPGITHVGLLRCGRLVATGPVRHVLTSPSVSACFDTTMEVGSSTGRWWAHARAGRT